MTPLIAAGLGQFADAIIGVVFALIVLSAIGRLDRRAEGSDDNEPMDRHNV